MKWELWEVTLRGIRMRRVDLGDKMPKTTEEITNFFTYMHKTHPHLDGKLLTFEEVPEDT